MGGITRRDAIKGGIAGIFGMAGVSGLVGCSQPPGGGAGSPWYWSSEGSIPATGSGQDPAYVWDDEADELVGSLMARGLIPEVNDKLRSWIRNDQPLPAGLPSDLVDFIERNRQYPDWIDWGRLVQANAFNQKRGLYLGVAYGFASGMMSTVIPHEARAVYYSKGGANMPARITKTAKLGYDIGTPNAFNGDGQMIVTCIKTRLAHAGVRNLLPNLDEWKATADQEVPISQRDMLVTWHSLPTTVMATLARWNVPINQGEAQGFLHSWQLTAHFLGIRDEYIPGNWWAAKQQAGQILTPILEPTWEGKQLAGQLLLLGSNIDSGLITRPVLGALTRYVLGDRIADWLDIPPDPIWTPIFNLFWEPFVAVRESALAVFPGTSLAFSTFEEILRLGVLFYLSTGQFPISITIPTTNNPYYEDH